MPKFTLPSTTCGPAGGEATSTLPVPDAAQWISTTTSRIAPDPYTWMQAVHWTHSASAHTPRPHGPRFGPTTVRLAQYLAQLNPCRPGVAYLARVLKASQRTVKYHLGLLRESGLLTYLVKGTRVRQERARASEFARTISPGFDQALGVRTIPSDTVIRTVVGVSEQGRSQLAKLGRKATRTVRSKVRKPKNRPSYGTSDCTPMEGGTSTSSPAALTTYPSESGPRNGKTSSPTSRRGAGRRALNAVGRRHRLALELVRQVPWLAGTPVPRVAWAIRHVADAGWTAHEVIAALAQRAPAHRIHRPAGFLTARLTGAELLYDTAAKRAAIVAWWRDSPNATRERHTEWAGPWRAPRSRAVARLVRDAFEGAKQRLQPVELPQQPSGDEHAQARTLAWRQYLAGQPALVTSALTLAGRQMAEQLYGTDLVERVLRLNSTTSHLTAGATR
jgi:DNA-binding transcriptional ArsR family regulator